MTFSEVVGFTLIRITPGWLLSGNTTQSPKCSSRVINMRFSDTAFSKI